MGPVGHVSNVPVLWSNTASDMSPTLRTSGHVGNVPHGYCEAASVMQERFTRRRLPHWDQPGATYFITTCLLGSIPAQGVVEIEQVRCRLERRPRPADVRPDDWKTRQWKRLFARREEWLDCKPAVRSLEDKRLAAEVVRSLKYFDGERYDLVAWVVMPSHLHWVFRPRDTWVQSLGTAVEDRSPRRRIQHSVNLHTAIECNRAHGRVLAARVV